MRPPSSPRQSQVPSLLYLHGFASGPGSTKARYFRDAFEGLGIPVEVPALDEGDFKHLTLSRQLTLLESLMDGRAAPRVLIGSSMGAYLAALYAETHQVEALVLLAPAVDFARRWKERLGPGTLARWEREGQMEVMHHAHHRPMDIGFGLCLDAGRHSSWPKVDAPVLVMHGRRDEVVSLESVQQWVAMNPSARLRLFESCHQLADCMDTMLAEAVAFLGSVPSVSEAWPGLR